MIKRIIIVFLLAFLVMSFNFQLAFANQDNWVPEVKFLTVGGGAVAWEVLAAKIANIINQEIPEIETNSIPGGGTINLTKLEKGDVQLALTQCYRSNWAFYGEEPYKEPYKNVRHLMTMYKGSFQAVVPKASNIKEWTDLTKMPVRFNVNKIGTGGNYGTIKMLEAYNITLDDIKNAGGTIHHVGYSDGKRMVQDGLLDIWISPDGTVPHAAILELERKPGVRFLKVSDEVIDKFIENFPGAARGILPKGSYETLMEDIPTVDFRVQLVVSSNLSDELVYRITKALITHLSEIQETFKGAETVTLETVLTANTIPIHSGASRYYKEIGLLK